MFTVIGSAVLAVLLATPAQVSHQGGKTQVGGETTTSSGVTAAGGGGFVMGIGPGLEAAEGSGLDIIGIIEPSNPPWIPRGMRAFPQAFPFEVTDISELGDDFVLVKITNEAEETVPRDVPKVDRKRLNDFIARFGVNTRAVPTAFLMTRRGQVYGRIAPEPNRASDFVNRARTLRQSRDKIVGDLDRIREGSIDDDAKRLEVALSVAPITVGVTHTTAIQIITAQDPQDVNDALARDALEELSREQFRRMASIDWAQFRKQINALPKARPNVTRVGDYHAVRAIVMAKVEDATEAAASLDEARGRQATPALVETAEYGIEQL